MSAALFQSLLWLLATPPLETPKAPVPSDYELWRVDQDQRAPESDSLSLCVLSRFDLANPNKPEQIPVEAPPGISVSAAARWDGLSGRLTRSKSTINDFLPNKPLFANKFVSGVLAISPGENWVLTFGLENDWPMPKYIDYQIVETKTKRKVFTGRFRGHCMRGEASGILTEGDTLAYFVKRSRSPFAKSHGHLIAASNQGSESTSMRGKCFQVRLETPSLL